MKKLLLLVFCLLLLPTPIWAAPTEDPSDQPKVSVVFYIPRGTAQEPEVMTAAVNMINKKFPPQKYSIAIWGRDSTPELVELAEKVRETGVFKKDYAVKYGKDTNSNYVVSMMLSVLDYKYGAWGGLKMQWQIDANVVDVATDKYIYTKTSFSPKKDSRKEAIMSCFDAFSKEFILPPEIVK